MIKYYCYPALYQIGWLVALHHRLSYCKQDLTKEKHIPQKRNNSRPDPFIPSFLPIVIGQVGGFNTFFATAENFAELPTFALWPVAAEDGGYLWYSGMHGIFYYIAAWMISIAGLNCPVLLQRTLAAKSVNVARKSFGISAVLYLAIGVVPAFIGIAAYTYGIILPVEDQEMVFPLVAELFLPSWLAVAVIVTLMIAIISTVGDSILTAATIFGHNVYGYFKPQSTPKEKLKMMRILIPVIAIVGMLIALLLSTVYRMILFAGGVVLVTVSIQYVLGFYWKKRTTMGHLPHLQLERSPGSPLFSSFYPLPWKRTPESWLKAKYTWTGPYGTRSSWLTCQLSLPP